MLPVKMSLMHTKSDSSLLKHETQQELATFALDELTTRPVTEVDTGRFRRFAVPQVLWDARVQGRPLSVAEAVKVAFLVNPPKYNSSARTMTQSSNATHIQRNSESRAADFVDYSFSNNAGFSYQSQPRTGILNNPPFVLPPPSASKSNNGFSPAQ